MDYVAPEALVSVRLTPNALTDKDMDAWGKWIMSVPSGASEVSFKGQAVRVEGLYRSYSSLLVIRMPVETWTCLPKYRAFSLIGYITGENQAHTINERLAAAVAEECPTPTAPTEAEAQAGSHKEVSKFEPEHLSDWGDKWDTATSKWHWRPDSGSKSPWMSLSEDTLEKTFRSRIRKLEDDILQKDLLIAKLQREPPVSPPAQYGGERQRRSVRYNAGRRSAQGKPWHRPVLRAVVSSHQDIQCRRCRDWKCKGAQGVGPSV